MLARSKTRPVIAVSMCGATVRNLLPRRRRSHPAHRTKADRSGNRTLAGRRKAARLDAHFPAGPSFFLRSPIFRRKAVLRMSSNFTACVAEAERDIVPLNLYGANLASVDLSGANLQKVDLRAV